MKPASEKVSSGRWGPYRQASPRRPGTAPALGLRAWEMCRHSIADQLEMGDPTMLLHSWLRRLRSTLAPGESQRHHPRRGCLRAATRGLNVEVLEDRALPSLIYTNSFPVGELPQAVVTASSPLVSGIVPLTFLAKMIMSAPGLASAA